MLEVESNILLVLSAENEPIAMSWHRKPHLLKSKNFKIRDVEFQIFIPSHSDENVFSFSRLGVK